MIGERKRSRGAGPGGGRRIPPGGRWSVPQRISDVPPTTTIISHNLSFSESGKGGARGIPINTHKHTRHAMSRGASREKRRRSRSSSGSSSSKVTRARRYLCLHAACLYLRGQNRAKQYAGRSFVLPQALPTVSVVACVALRAAGGHEGMRASSGYAFGPSFPYRRPPET